MTVHVTAPMLAAYNHFRDAGFHENGAGAPVGNFVQESGEFLITTMFRSHPDASGGVPDALKSGGIAEWLGDRKTAYIAFSGRAETRFGLAKGSLLNDLGTQCDFVVYELQTNPAYATLYHWLTVDTGRSIATLTYNFCWIYEDPAKATANLDNRVAHAEAVVAKARLLKAPHPAPPAPIPLPPAPPPVIPQPAPHSGPSPPISASAAGRQLAVRDNLEAIRRAYLDEIATAQNELAIVETAIADFGKLAPLPSPSPVQIPPSNPTEIMQQGNTMQAIFLSILTNWATSALGTMAGGPAVIDVLQNPANWQHDLPGIATVLLGLLAKDGWVTGGVKPATPEAKKRVGVA